MKWLKKGVLLLLWTLLVPFSLIVIEQELPAKTNLLGTYIYERPYGNGWREVYRMLIPWDGTAFSIYDVETEERTDGTFRRVDGRRYLVEGEGIPLQEIEIRDRKFFLEYRGETYKFAWVSDAVTGLNPQMRLHSRW